MVPGNKYSSWGIYGILRKKSKYMAKTKNFTMCNSLDYLKLARSHFRLMAFKSAKTQLISAHETNYILARIKNSSN